MLFPTSASKRLFYSDTVFLTNVTVGAGGRLLNFLRFTWALIQIITVYRDVCFYDVTYFCFSGYYLFIEASSPRRPGDKARLVSEQFNNRGSTPRCFTFWYHMYGSAIGKLRVFSKIQNGRETLLWNLTGQQQPSRTSAWKYASTPMIHDTDHVVSCILLAIS